MLLTDQELDALFVEWKTPLAGRKLIREIRTNGPVRNLQSRMDGVRTRLVSRKMEGRALYAESRTCEFPAIYLREQDPETVEIWPQPCTLDLTVSGPKGGSTRYQHTPDLFIIEHGFIIEEWREFDRLVKLAEKYPDRFYRDEQGRWHNVPAEKYLKELGIEYRLRCADELPHPYVSNLRFLEDYTLENSAPVDAAVGERMVSLLKEHKRLPHLSLIHEYKFTADEVFKLLLDGACYVNLYDTVLHKTGELILYRDRDIARADALLRLEQSVAVPSCTLALEVGSRFLFDGKAYEVAILGTTEVIARDVESGSTTKLGLDLVEKMFQSNDVNAESERRAQQKLKESLIDERRLAEGLERVEALANPETTHFSARTLRRYREKTLGLLSPQDKLDALIPRNPGNTTPRLPEEVTALAAKTMADFHNKPAKPTTAASYSFYITLCDAAGMTPMGRSSFFRYAAAHADTLAREGKRMEYQKAPIPLSFDYDHPVHGVLPHEVCYCDHTIINEFLKGSQIQNLGKPTFTVMIDGALSMSRAMYLSYHPANTNSVLMCLRDYVRRNKRLPKILVLDNGKEFHSYALSLFASLFGITLVFRRRSRPRDSSIVERAIGATEQEVISQLNGNSLALKDPRMVSSTHHPDKHIEWTLPGLYGAIEYYLFKLHANRIHPRFGVSPIQREQQLILETGAREHIVVRFDETFKLLTAPAPRVRMRVVDKIRGIYVDGQHYWHPSLAQASTDEKCDVRVEMWNARIVYACFRGQWLIAQARDGGVLEGRFRIEFEMQTREEKRRKRTLAQADKNTPVNAARRVECWTPENWDPRLREQSVEAYLLYSKLEMTEVFSAARNLEGDVLNVSPPKLGAGAYHDISEEAAQYGDESAFDTLNAESDQLAQDFEAPPAAAPTQVLEVPRDAQLVDALPAGTQPVDENVYF